MAGGQPGAVKGSGPPKLTSRWDERPRGFCDHACVPPSVHTPLDSVGARVRRAGARDALAEHAARAELQRRLFGAAPRAVALDRYVIVSRLGQGGDGVVYGAWDPELDRRVAIKALRRRGAGAEAQLLREARLLARLRHPNIVQIHAIERDDSEGAEAGVFFVMEFVPGGDVVAWLARAPRSWRMIVRMYAAVARALGAAHRIGVVHRDVKPTNVLVGDDGAPRVVDFGLAQGRDAGGSGLNIAGTLPYMAPEQHRGEVPDGRADQYALGVSLYEGLVGQRPFVGNASVLLRSKELAAYPKVTGVPRRVARILTRALDPQPSRRFVDMDALAAALESAARERSVQTWAIVAGAVALAVGVGMARRNDPCPLPERSPAELARERPVVEAYAADWSAAWTNACTHARVDAEVSPTVHEAQLECFDRQAEALEGALDELDHQRGLADPASPVIEAMALAAALESPARCDADAMTAIDPEAARDWGPSAAWRGLARARVLHELGRDVDALAVLGGVEADLGDVEAPLLRARLHWVASSAHASAGEFEQAKQSALQSLWAAEAIRDHAIAARAWIDLAWLEGVERQDPEAQRWLAFATAAVARTGDDPWLLAELHHLRAGLDYRAGDLEGARVEYTAALVGQRALVGEQHPWTARTRNHLGNVAFEAGDLELAIAHSTAALVVRRQTLPPSHPLVAAALNNLAGMHLARGELRRARGFVEDALALTAGQGGPPELFARVLQGRIAAASGERGAAVEGFRAALGVRMAQLERGHPAVRDARAALAELRPTDARVEGRP
jgi:eukaryotic-like serine/threonine-protein kinase